MTKLFVFAVVAIAISYQFLGVDAFGKHQVKNALHHLMNIVDKALNDAQRTLDKAVEQFQATSSNLENNAKAELDKTLEPLRKKLDDLVNKAKSNGFDVSKCQNYIDDFSHTPEKLTHNLLVCADTQVTAAHQVATDALNQLKKIGENLKRIDSDIDNCSGNPWRQVKCYTKLMARIGKETKEAPAKIVADVRKVTLLLSKLVPTMAVCFLDQLKQAGIGATKDVVKFAICAGVSIN